MTFLGQFYMTGLDLFFFTVYKLKISTELIAEELDCFTELSLQNLLEQPINLKESS